MDYEQSVQLLGIKDEDTENEPVYLDDTYCNIEISNNNHNNNININQLLKSYLSEYESVVGCSSTLFPSALVKSFQDMPYGTMILFNKSTNNHNAKYCSYMNKLSCTIKAFNCSKYAISDNEEYYSYIDIETSANDKSMRWTNTADNFLILGDISKKKINKVMVKRFIPKAVLIGRLKYNGAPQNYTLIRNCQIAETYMNHWNTMFLVSEPIKFTKPCCWLLW